jgi:WD domain, G-beta repeat/WD40-like Beta Propeller Repeat
VWSIAFSPDGKTLATRKALGEPLKAHLALVESIAFTPDGKTLATSSLDGDSDPLGYEYGFGKLAKADLQNGQ